MVPARPTDANAPTFPPPAYEPLSSPLCNSGDSAPTMGVGLSSGPMPWMPVPRVGILMLTCHQFLNKPAIPNRLHGPEPKVLMVLVNVVIAFSRYRDAVRDRQWQARSSRWPLAGK